ncbi:PcfJ domain-containing protein [uncultured Microbulbifer sp.]|uniref:PcfJ domain-containing protein n=1 Tax=uncultured Microbulbifer sp. TaxID=348147 RepID=UPI00262BB242|nr:PcfJ domain-containing protein [uncultured Microbulbifer sp.]
MEIEVDTKKRIITVGDWVLNSPIYYNIRNENILDVKKEVLMSNGIDFKPIYKEYGAICFRSTHKIICEHLGPYFNRRIVASSLSLWIDPIRRYLDISSFYSTGFKNYYRVSQVLRTWKHLQKVKCADKDNQQNIIPLITYFGATPEKLKIKFGKGIWKKLCKKSKTTNKYIVIILEYFFNDKSRVGGVINFDRHLVVLNTLCRLKASLIAYIHRNKYLIDDFRKDVHRTETLFFWLNDNALVSNPNDLTEMMYICIDTERMSNHLGQVFRPWKRASMIKRHDKFSKAITARQYTDKPFENLPEIDNKITISGINILLLRSPWQVANEGYEMNHCIASYIELIQSGLYLAFSLKSKNGRSTLGVYKKGSRYIKDQHCTFGSRTVTEKNTILAEKYIVNNLNKLISGNSSCS